MYSQWIKLPMLLNNRCVRLYERRSRVFQALCSIGTVPLANITVEIIPATVESSKNSIVAHLASGVIAGLCCEGVYGPTWVIDTSRKAGAKEGIERVSQGGWNKPKQGWFDGVRYAVRAVRDGGKDPIKICFGSGSVLYRRHPDLV
jgi:hypothetical protein